MSPITADPWNSPDRSFGKAQGETDLRRGVGPFGQGSRCWRREQERSACSPCGSKD